MLLLELRKENSLMGLIAVDKQLDGKVAFATGVTAEIGRATALTFAREGAKRHAG